MAATTLQIRSFPDELKVRLRARARQVDLTMSDYVIQLVRRDLDQPTVDEWLARLDRLPSHDGSPGLGAGLVAEGRDEHQRGAPWRS